MSYQPGAWDSASNSIMPFQPNGISLRPGSTQSLPNLGPIPYKSPSGSGNLRHCLRSLLYYVLPGALVSMVVGIIVAVVTWALTPGSAAPNAIIPGRLRVQTCADFEDIHPIVIQSGICDNVSNGDKRRLEIRPHNFSALSDEDVLLYQITDPDGAFPIINDRSYYQSLRTLIYDSGRGKRHLPGPPDGDIPIVGDPPLSVQRDQIIIGPHDFELKYWQDHFCSLSQAMFPITRYVITNDDGKSWQAYHTEDFFANRGIGYRWDCRYLHAMTLLFVSPVDEGANLPVIYHDKTWKVMGADKNGTQPGDLPDLNDHVSTGHGLSIGAFVGIIVGVAVVSGILTSIVFWIWTRWRRQQTTDKPVAAGTPAVNGNVGTGNTITSPPQQVSQASAPGVPQASAV